MASREKPTVWYPHYVASMCEMAVLRDCPTLITKRISTRPGPRYQIGQSCRIAKMMRLGGCLTLAQPGACPLP
jgi:hypothetical protein